MNPYEIDNSTPNVMKIKTSMIYKIGYGLLFLFGLSYTRTLIFSKATLLAGIVLLLLTIAMAVVFIYHLLPASSITIDSNRQAIFKGNKRLIEYDDVNIIKVIDERPYQQRPMEVSCLHIILKKGDDIALLRSVNKPAVYAVADQLGGLLSVKVEKYEIKKGELICMNNDSSSE